MAVELATAYVSIVPSFQNLQGNLQRGLNAPLAAAGSQAGQNAGRSAGHRFAGGFAAVAKIGLAGVAAGLAGVFKVGLDEVKDASAGAAQLAAGIKSTGNAAHVTVGGMEALASSIEGYSGQTDDSVVSAEKLLLTFTNIKNQGPNKIFDLATKAAADMAAKMGGDASSQAILLGKALNDPVKGVTALTRVGVSFTKAQRDQIAAMVKTGDTIGAQKIILHELNTEFGGAAKAAGQSLPGQLAIARRSFEGVAQKVVTSLLPAIQGLTKFLTNTAIPAFDKLVSFIQAHSGVFEVLAASVAGLWVAFKGYRAIQSANRAITDLRRSIAAFRVGATASRISSIFTGIGSAATGMGRYVKTAFRTAGTALSGIPAAARGASGLAGRLGAVGGGALAAGAALGPLALGVAAVGAAVYVGTKLWNKHKDAEAAAAAKAAAHKSIVDNLTQAIEADNGALGANTRAYVAAALQADGTLDAARRQGVSLKTYTDAILGVPKAYAYVQQQLHGSADPNFAGQFVEAGADADLLTKSLGEYGTAAGGAVASSKNITDAVGGVASNSLGAKVVTDALATSTQKVADKFHIVVTAGGAFARVNTNVKGAAQDATAALDKQTAASQKLKQAEDILNGVAQNSELANNTLTISLGGLTNKTALFHNANNKVSTSLDKTTVAGATNRTMLVGLVDDAKAAAQATADQAYAHNGKLGPALRAGNKELRANEGRIRKAAEAAHLDKGETDKLIKSVGIVATLHAHPSIDLRGATTALQRAKRIQDYLNGFGGKTYTAHVSLSGDTTITGRNAAGGVFGGHLAAGGPVVAGVPYVVGEHRAELFVPDQNGRIIPSVPAPVKSGGQTVNVNQTINNPIPERASVSGPAGLRRAAYALDRA